LYGKSLYCIDDEQDSTSSIDDCFMRSCRMFTELVTSNDRFRRKANLPLYVTIDETASASTIKIPLTRYASRVSRLFCVPEEWLRTRTPVIETIATNGAYIHFRNRKRRLIEISRHELQTGFSFRYFFPYGRYEESQIHDCMEQRALACATDRVDAVGIAQTKPLLVRSSAGHQDAGGYRGEAFAPGNGMC